MPLQERADGGVALGHPGALVQQRGRVEERRHVDLDEARAEPLQHLRRRRARPPSLAHRRRSAGPAARGTPMTGCGGGSRRAPSAIGRENGSASSWPAITAIGPPGVVHRAGEHRDAVERAAGRHHAPGRHRADRRLQADDVVEARPARGPSPRCRCRARTPPARAPPPPPSPELDPPGTMLGIDGVARHRIGRAHADQAGGELVEVGLADQQRAGGEQPLHHVRVGVRRVGEGRAGGRGRQPGDVDVVLDGEGDAPQRLGHGIEAAELLRRLAHRLAVGERDEDAGIVDARRSRRTRARRRAAGSRPPRVGRMQAADVDRQVVRWTARVCS